MRADGELLSQKELAARLLLTSRQVHNLTEQGMPRRLRQGRPMYDWAAALRWYIAKKEELAAEKAGKKAPKNDVYSRKLEAETRLQEIELAEKERQLLSIDYAERQLTGTLERVRAKLLNMPGKYAPAMVGLRTIAEAQQRLEGAIAEAMGAMTDIGEDPELDAGDDGADREGGMAA